MEKIWIPITTLICVAFLLGLLIMYHVDRNILLHGNANANLDFSGNSVHMTITFWKDGVKVFEQYHAGAVTKLGMNVTLAKLTGNSSLYNMTQYNLNVTLVGIGNQGTLNTDSTILPGEWNRTAATQHDGLYNSCNWTAVFYPDVGPYTADCIGLYYEAGIAGPNALWAYDTFSEVTGIDDTFTITVEFKVSIS